MATYPARPTPTQDTSIEKDPTEPGFPLLGTTSTGVQPGGHNGGSEKRPWTDWIVLLTAVVAAAVLGGVVVWLTERGKCERYACDSLSMSSRIYTDINISIGVVKSKQRAP